MGLISKKRGKPGNHRLPKYTIDYAVSLIKQHYPDFGPTLATEKLAEIHGVTISVETVRKLMIEHDIWIPKSKRATRAYQPRYRRERFGELIQIDRLLYRKF